MLRRVAHPIELADYQVRIAEDFVQRLQKWWKDPPWKVAFERAICAFRSDIALERKPGLYLVIGRDLVCRRTTLHLVYI